MPSVETHDGFPLQVRTGVLSLPGHQCMDSDHCWLEGSPGNTWSHVGPGPQELEWELGSSYGGAGDTSQRGSKAKTSLGSSRLLPTS